MVIGGKTSMLSDVSVRRNLEDGIMNGSNDNLEDILQSELELILQEQHNRKIRNGFDRERDLNIFRSGSAPPTIEGSLSAVGNLFRNPNSVLIDNSSSNADAILSEEEIRSHPAYLAYYYSHENLNPRLPPPLVSREAWRVAQRFQAGGSSFGGIGDWRKKNGDDIDGSSSLFSMQPSLSVQKAEDELIRLRKATPMNLLQPSSGERLNRGSDGLIGLSGAGLGARRKSFADILQEGLDQPASLSGHVSRPASRSSFVDIVDTTGISSCNSPDLCNELESPESATNADLPRVQSLGSIVSHSFASAVAAPLLRSRTPEPQLIGKSSSLGFLPVGTSICTVEKKNISGSNGRLSDIVSSLSNLSMSKHRLSHEDLVQLQLQRVFDKPNQLLDMSNGQTQNQHHPFVDNSEASNLDVLTSYADFRMKNGIVTDQNVSRLGFDGQINLPQTSCSTNLYSEPNPSGFTSLERSNMDFSVSTLTGGRNGQNLISSNQAGSDLHSAYLDPHYIQYLQKTSDYAMHVAASSDDISQGRNYFGTSHAYEELQRFQKVYLEPLFAQQKNQCETPLLHKSGSSKHERYMNPALGLGMSYQGNPNSKSGHQSGGYRGPMLQNEQSSCSNSMLRSTMGGSSGVWHSGVGTKMDGVLVPSLLEEVKNNKTRSFELSDIVDNVVEFSMDQYGSRFIQQKLETASVEEKTDILQKIIPHARALMTDVFGNYVIQKFFEHGTETQRKEIACQITGHVLPLSLQMYGCRVIQKALEVIDVEQQTQMVAELGGSIMKCVRDQNGNHVIQKCMECIPQDRIQFIISAFFGQVAALSTHPYGCRVIQRVLEHCDDPKTQQIIMDEIMHSVCTLAQDQYGNYVVQHVLQHGKPHERSAIIRKLAGQIVKMSQQKFASNVVEKCLTFGGLEERQLLISEMLGSTDENAPLQAMMKDPFGNYVVQKVLETCDDQNRELILSRIKVHLNALKSYTYGKHIVSRIEKLVMTGERHSGLASSYSS